MADDANIRLRNAEKASSLGGRLLVIESHYNDKAIALLQHLNARRKLSVIEPRDRRRFGNEIAAEPRQQFLLTTAGAPKMEDGHTTRAEHEVRELLGLPQSGTAKRFEHAQQNLLHEIVRSRWRS